MLGNGATPFQAWKGLRTVQSSVWSSCCNGATPFQAWEVVSVSGSTWGLTCCNGATPFQAWEGVADGVCNGDAYKVAIGPRPLRHGEFTTQYMESRDYIQFQWGTPFQACNDDLSVRYVGDQGIAIGPHHFGVGRLSQRKAHRVQDRVAMGPRLFRRGKLFFRQNQF